MLYYLLITENGFDLTAFLSILNRFVACIRYTKVRTWPSFYLQDGDRSLLGTGLHSRPFDFDDSSGHVASGCLLFRPSCFRIGRAWGCLKEHTLGLKDLFEVVLLLVRDEALIHDCLEVCLIRGMAPHRLLT